MEPTPKIERILFATDLSDYSNNAFRYAMTVASLSGARITVLHVYGHLPPNAELLLMAFLGVGSREELRQKSQEEIIRSIRDYLENFCAAAVSEIPACPILVDQILVDIGKPADRILHHAAGCELIVMGARGFGLVKEALIGSTSRKVLKRSRIPVLVIPAP